MTRISHGFIPLLGALALAAPPAFAGLFGNQWQKSCQATNDPCITAHCVVTNQESHRNQSGVIITYEYDEWNVNVPAEECMVGNYPASENLVIQQITPFPKGQDIVLSVDRNQESEYHFIPEEVEEGNTLRLTGADATTFAGWMASARLLVLDTESPDGTTTDLEIDLAGFGDTLDSGGE